MPIDVNNVYTTQSTLEILLLAVAAGLLSLLVLRPFWRMHQRTRAPREGDVWRLCDGRLATVMSATAAIVVSGVSVSGDRDSTRRCINACNMGEWITLLKRTDARLVRRGPRRRTGKHAG